MFSKKNDLRDNKGWEVKLNKVLCIGILLLLITGITTAIVYRNQFDVMALESWTNNAGSESITGAEGLVQKIMLVLAFLAVMGILPRLIGRLRRRPMMDVDVLNQKMDAGEDILLLDVRTSKDYLGEQGHIKNSVLIPVEELEKRLTEIDDFQEKTVMTLCRADRRSAKAAQILTKHDFADVHIIRGGMTAWHETGYAIEANELQDE